MAPRKGDPKGSQTGASPAPPDVGGMTTKTPSREAAKAARGARSPAVDEEGTDDAQIP